MSEKAQESTREHQKVHQNPTARKQSIKPKHVWVVEISKFWPWHKEWEPCTGIALTKLEGHSVLKQWRTNVLGAKFRLTKYVRANP